MGMVFSEADFPDICRLLIERDQDLAGILARHGYPPMWTRKEGFSTLILIILEQQVSLASAYAAFKRLKQKVKRVTPRNILALSDADFRECSFSRQKILYARELATAVQGRRLRLGGLARASDEEIRARLKEIKGIGDWTVDVYLMHALQRSDLFPLGDVALVSSLRETKGLASGATKDEMLAVAESWRPYRTIAAMILWHAYIQKRGIRIEM